MKRISIIGLVLILIVATILLIIPTHTSTVLLSPRAELQKISSGGIVSPNNQIFYPTTRAKGVIILIHGGGWRKVGPTATDIYDKIRVPFFLNQGWVVYNIDYRTGQNSLRDVVAAYQLIHSRIGTSYPICIAGYSAGGNLAMMLAADQPSVSCIISEGGPTDLVSFRYQSAFAYPGITVHSGPDYIYNRDIVPSFGTSRLSLLERSPVYYANFIHAKMLLGSSSYDFYVPQQQMVEMAKLKPKLTTTMLLAGSSKPKYPPNFTHASITKRALATWNMAQVTLLNSVYQANELRNRLDITPSQLIVNPKIPVDNFRSIESRATQIRDALAAINLLTS